METGGVYDTADGVLSDMHVASPHERSTCTVCAWIDATDEDGDLMPPRRGGEPGEAGMHKLRIWHTACATPLDLVGMQIWRGAVALCDYLWAHRGSLLQGRHILELGAGCGLVSLLAATGGAQVLLTDAPAAVLHNAMRNVAAAHESVRERVRVRRLDWSQPVSEPLCPARSGRTPADDRAGTAATQLPSGTPFEWGEADAELLRRSELVLCADCIYDVAATEQLLRMLRDLLHALSTGTSCGGAPAFALVSLERRLNFALPTLCEADASAYARFRELLLPLDSAVLCADGSAWQRSDALLVGEQLDTRAVPPSMRGAAGEAAGLGGPAAQHVEIWRLRVVLST